MTEELKAAVEEAVVAEVVAAEAGGVERGADDMDDVNLADAVEEEVAVEVGSMRRRKQRN